MPILWNSIPNGSWEVTLSQSLVQRPLGMGEGSVSVASSLLSLPLVALRPVLRGSDFDQECGSAADSDCVFFPNIPLLLP